MVDVSSKGQTTRSARATATLLFSHADTYSILVNEQLAKGDAIAVARIAAIQAAKKTADLIPLAHPALNITSVSINIRSFSGQEQSTTSTTTRDGQSFSQHHRDGGVTVEAAVKCQGKTGIEMEALTAATIGVVTLYDMLKAVDKDMVVTAARVVSKQGGKSGDWIWDPQKNELVRSVDSEVVSAEDGQVEEPTAPVSFSTPNTVTLSEVDEWNEGLTGEFLIRESANNGQASDAGRSTAR